MPSQSNGLRFDIYERVHLPDEVAAIDELDEIELVPRIGIVQQEEQVLLKGHLLLTGVYRSEEQPLSEQSLEHWIPVEITLPLNRIHRLDDISVEIDNFDVDVLSTRTLNITGVLSLFGIEIEQSNPQGEWQREEPYTVVHSREEDEIPFTSSPFFAQQPQFWQPEQRREAAEDEALRYASFQSEAEEAREALARAAIAREQELLEAARLEEARQEEARQEEARQEEARQEEARQEAARQEAAQLEAAREETARQEEARQEAARREAEQFEAVRREAALREAARQEAERQEAAQEAERAEAFRPEEAEVPAEAAAPPSWQSPSVADASAPAEEPAVLVQAEAEPAIRQPAPPAASDPFGEVSVPEAEAEPKPLRVAFSGKPAEEEAAQQGAGNVSFRSLLQSSRREQEAKAAAEQHAEREAEQSRKSSGDEIEWKNLFFGRPNDDNAFRKVRICIVQREETLDVIAGRYQLQPRELALYNRLSDQSVSEGQVLYIP
ncbi:LysM peptidoglycan-binding domain-containing protein [Paenibacillus sp. MWE-103]|uniref:LysM peptidoglycan-binding domain-containing protein n=1 Tax=Paenibacillus artemisiicola TaxID=1172618 RepID=A0ABS3WAY9_9BACL|nr:LysM peptidoglycan-binding domain-containing protein [Paenibacillus artemisiicola]